MSNQLLPCPFCGAEPAPFWNGVGCVKAKCAMDGLHISIEAWNRRATQPAAGEPVYQWREDQNQRWWTTSKADYEWILKNRPGYQARILWTAPPAAAHGDEAVRSKLCDAYERGYQDGQKWPDSYSLQADKDKVADELIAAMRAQGDGGES